MNRSVRNRLWNAWTGWWLFKPVWLQLGVSRAMCLVWGHHRDRSDLWCGYCGVALSPRTRLGGR